MRARPRLWALYFNRSGASPVRTWVLRELPSPLSTPSRGRERYFTSVILGPSTTAHSHYRPSNSPPIPKAWLTVRGVLLRVRRRNGWAAIIEL